jgi:hypothetical protein
MIYLFNCFLATVLTLAFWHWFLQPQIKRLLADYRELKLLLKKLKEEDNE